MCSSFCCQHADKMEWGKKDFMEKREKVQFSKCRVVQASVNPGMWEVEQELSVYMGRRTPFPVSGSPSCICARLSSERPWELFPSILYSGGRV